MRAALRWLPMRAQNGQVYSTDTGRLHPFAEDLLRVRGDVDVVAHDLMASLQACADAVMGSIEGGRVPVVIGGDDSLLYACVKGFPRRARRVDRHHPFRRPPRPDGREPAARTVQPVERNAARPGAAAGERRALDPGRRPQLQLPSLVRVHPEDRARLPAAEFHELGTSAAVERIASRLEGCDHVWWAFDIDVIDPSAAPGAGAHEPGGLTSRQVLDCVRLLADRCGGLSIVEVNPLTDIGDMTSTLAANLAFSFVIFGQEAR